MVRKAESVNPKGLNFTEQRQMEVEHDIILSSEMNIF